GLSRTDRVKRAAESFEAVWKRFNTCATQSGLSLNAAVPETETDTTKLFTPANDIMLAPPTPLQLLYNSGSHKLPTAKVNNLREDMDEFYSMMQYVFEVECVTLPICTDMDLTDQALLMLAKHENGK